MVSSLPSIVSALGSFDCLMTLKSVSISSRCRSTDGFRKSMSSIAAPEVKSSTTPLPALQAIAVAMFTFRGWSLPVPESASAMR